MANDPADELARRRSKRDRSKRAGRPEATGDTRFKIDQDHAIARARESWALRRGGPEWDPPEDAADED
jgi:hypothetical protein